MSNPGGIDFNVSPYFDDYDEEKKFARILFRPGRAVQARELTQLQSILQKQVENLGKYFFKEGSVVEGCEVSINLNVPFLKLQKNYSSTEVNLSEFKGKHIVGASTGVEATVNLTEEESGVNPKTLYISYDSLGKYVLTVNAISNLLVSGNTISTASGNGQIDYWDYNLNKIFVSNVANSMLATEVATTVDANGATVFLTITNSSDKRSTSVFEDNETVFTHEGIITRDYANTATSQATSHTENDVTYISASTATIRSGVIYIANHFVKNSPQTIILDRYKNEPSYKIGVVAEKTIVDHIEDVSLVDNAQGTPNYQAPGADRLKINSVLKKLELGDETSQQDFYTLLEVENGLLRRRFSIEIDSKIEDAIAKRIYEESGDYTLSNPKVIVRDHLIQGDNDGVFTLAEGGNTNLLLLELDPFVAYVRGYRNEFYSKQSLEIEKGLDVQSFDLRTQINYSNYVDVDGFVGLLNIMEATKVNLINASNVVIGEARVRSIEYVSGTVGQATARYRVYLFDVVMTSSQNFTSVRRITQTEAGRPACSANVVLDTNGTASIKESSFNTTIIQLPYEGIKTIRGSDNVVESEFVFKKEYDVSFSTTGVATISTGDNNESFVGSGLLSTTQKNENFIVIPTSTVTSSGGSPVTFTVGVPINFDSRNITVTASGSSVTIDLGLSFGTSFNAKVVATVNRINAREMRKVLFANTEIYIQANTHPRGLSGPYSLGRADVYQVRGIYQSTSFAITPTTANTNVTSLYTFDNGQRDNTYEHATITPKAGVTPTGRLLVVYDYFSHDTTQGVGYLSVDSYPIDDVNETSTTINTADIPVYTSRVTGATYDLRNCLDFRVRKLDDTANTTNPFDRQLYQIPVGGLHIPQAYSNFDTTLSIYKGRVAKVYLDSEGNVKILNGSPGYPKPVTPSSLFGTLDLAIVRIPPYPSLPTTVGVQPQNNKRYTMKDIGKLEERLDSLVYYTTLNHLEKQATGTSVLDENGLDRFKNGILVDPFSGFNVADVNSSYLKTSINRQEKYATAEISLKQTGLVLDSSSLTGGEAGNTSFYKSKNGKLFAGTWVYAPTDFYGSTTSILSVNPYASSIVSIIDNPGEEDAGDMIETFGGILGPNPPKASFIEVYPSSDTWFQTTNTRRNLLSVNDASGSLDNWSLKENAWETELDAIQTRWLGVPIQTEGSESSSTIGRIFDTTPESQFDVVTSQIALSASNDKVNSRVVDVTITPYMRSRDYIINVEGIYKTLEPEYNLTTRLTPGFPAYNINGNVIGGRNWDGFKVFIDNVDVTSNVSFIGLRSGKTVSDVFDLMNSSGRVAANTSVYYNYGNPTVNTDVGRVIPADYVAKDLGGNLGAPGSLWAGINPGKFRAILNLPDNTFRTGQRVLKVVGVCRRWKRNPSSGYDTAYYPYEDVIAEAIISARGIHNIETDTTIDTRHNDIMWQHLNPVAQSFFIDSNDYPDGAMITAIDLFFAAKFTPAAGASATLIADIANSRTYVQIREMKNGVPALTSIGGATTFVLNSQINTSPVGVVPTTFTFKAPVYLSPGKEYCFTVLSERYGANYIWISEFGRINVAGDGRTIDKQLAAGKLFVQNSTTNPYAFGTSSTSAITSKTWSPRETQDLKYVIYAINTYSSNLYKKFTFNNTSSVNYSPAHIIDVGANIPAGSLQFTAQTIDSIGNIETIPVQNGELNEFSRNRFVQKVFVDLRATQFVSPTIDLERVQLISYDYKINNLTSNVASGTVTFSSSSNTVVGVGTSFTTQLTKGSYVLFGSEFREVLSITNNTHLIVSTNFTTSGANVAISHSNEENPEGPYSSQSRYISRRVELADGFEANDLIVYVDVNKLPGTNIKVYYKILNEADNDSFDDKFYQEMTLEGTPIFNQDKDAYFTEKYIVPASIKSGGSFTLNGTVSVSNVSTTVTGSSTRFFEELKIGNTITVDDEARVVTDIANNTSITVDSAFSTATSGATAYKQLFDAINYSTPDNRVYSGYKYFAIKIVFLSSDTAIAPKIKKLRAIALT